MPEQKDKFARYAWGLLFVGAVVRLLLMTWLRPFLGHLYFDSTYIQTGRDILHFNFHALGDRVPVYPLLTAVCGFNFRAIWVAQSILGVAASLMIFDLAFRRTRHALFSLLVGLFCSLIPEVLLFEAEIFTETLTNFLLVTSLWFIIRYGDGGENNIRYPLGLGLILGLLGLTRPSMICLVPVYYYFLVPIFSPTKILRRAAIERSLLFALPVAVLFLGWCGLNYINNGFFSPTTRAGQQLMDQVDPYVDLAPDRFAALRDAWVQSRQQHPPFPDDTAEVVYAHAEPTMEKRTGQSAAQVSHAYASLALYLEIHHPLLCLRRVEQGLMQFWGEPEVDEAEWPDGGEIGVAECLMATSNFLMREVKAVFLVFALLSIPCALFRLKVFTRIEYLIFAMTAWVSLFSAFAEFGDNRRFCIPFYMLIFYTLATWAWIWIAVTASQGSGAAAD